MHVNLSDDELKTWWHENRRNSNYKKNSPPLCTFHTTNSFPPIFLLIFEEKESPKKYTTVASHCDSFFVVPIQFYYIWECVLIVAKIIIPNQFWFPQQFWKCVNWMQKNFIILLLSSNLKKSQRIFETHTLKVLSSCLCTQLPRVYQTTTLKIMYALI